MSPEDQNHHAQLQLPGPTHLQETGKTAPTPARMAHPPARQNQTKRQQQALTCVALRIKLMVD